MMIAAAITCAGMVLVLMLFRKLGSPAGSLPLTADWIDELSIERYKPMIVDRCGISGLIFGIRLIAEIATETAMPRYIARRPRV